MGSTVKMRITQLFVLASVSALAYSHATIQAAWINGVDQGQGDSRNGYIRFPPNNSPVLEVTSSDMTCNKNSGPVAKTLQVKAGDEFEWRHQSRTAGDQIIDPSHKGPILVYIANTDQGAAGRGWVKLYEDGYNGQWAVERLRANGGRHGITIPDIAPGKYLLRAEIIALHEAFSAKGAQFYMECVQIEVTSSGSKTLPAGVSLPGAYSANDPGILFNLYNGFQSYTIPGPPVWDGASGPPQSSVAASSASTKISSASQVPTSSTSQPTTLQTRLSTSSTAHTLTSHATTTPAQTTTAPAQPTTPPATGVKAGYIYEQCAGNNWTGPKGCYEGLVCTEFNPWYSQCLPGQGPRPASIWEQCGGQDWPGAKTCHPGLVCNVLNPWYSQCIRP